ncbi:hypothetical protein GCM10025867_05900 [Frondihabitans sucicola]|uniref:DUF6314 domain-containing protein n=1 Tax=Frondihabitans sucicola TaxID=1268041 RepID=A0ABM8GIY2_9MICO|nr:DUF6314 family protein [Frondihabitans sucicola]BDZ48349.1 hypothetical protein GCM10025867_05900 [Frondihabitans sucicola]
MLRVDFLPPDLVGRWAFERVVDDRLAGQTIGVEGAAVFSRRDDTTIDWREQGTMHLPSGDVPVTTHRVLTREGAGPWSVDFADGRGFHAWATGTELLHDCAPDLYRGRLDPEPASATAGVAPGAWTMRWAATGPAKDYVIDTRYEFRAAV